MLVTFCWPINARFEYFSPYGYTIAFYLRPLNLPFQSGGLFMKDLLDPRAQIEENNNRSTTGHQNPF